MNDPRIPLAGQNRLRCQTGGQHQGGTRVMTVAAPTPAVASSNQIKVHDNAMELVLLSSFAKWPSHLPTSQSFYGTCCTISRLTLLRIKLMDAGHHSTDQCDRVRPIRKMFLLTWITSHRPHLMYKRTPVTILLKHPGLLPTRT